jgi:hypothetical protein
LAKTLEGERGGQHFAPLFHMRWLPGWLRPIATVVAMMPADPERDQLRGDEDGPGGSPPWGGSA